GSGADRPGTPAPRQAAPARTAEPASSGALRDHRGRLVEKPAETCYGLDPRVREVLPAARGRAADGSHRAGNPRRHRAARPSRLRAAATGTERLAVSDQRRTQEMPGAR